MHNKAMCDVGMIGLGVMGRNLVFNIASHGFSVAGFDTDPDKVIQLEQESQGLSVYGTNDVKSLVALLKPPRSVILLVPAGKAVDAVIEELLPFLQDDDLIIDAGNSYFKDTDKRTAQLKKRQIQFMGVGISGGEAGARFGPSIMPGGSEKSWNRIQPIFEAIAAKAGGTPCVAYLGHGSVGHFVKMVHNGIEYAIMQLIAETYDFLKRGLDLQPEALQKIYHDWNKDQLSSYLLEITGDIFGQIDDKTHQPLINIILPVAKQNGTGMWTSQSAMELQIPTPTIDWAVAMRDLSVFQSERQQASKIYSKALTKLCPDQDAFLQQLREAFFAALIIVYAEGMALLKIASDTYHYELNLETVASIWRGGCIIRAALLEDLVQAFQTNPDLSNPLLDPELSKKLITAELSLRQIVCLSAQSGIPAPGFMASLSYLDGYRSAWLPANLIQAQRDYFGSHTYERSDMPGNFHTEWKQ